MVDEGMRVLSETKIFGDKFLGAKVQAGEDRKTNENGGDDFKKFSHCLERTGRGRAFSLYFLTKALV